MKLLFIDNNDSFTYNLIHILREYNVDFEKIGVNDYTADMSLYFDKLLISPGPGLPGDYPALIESIQKYSDSKSIFGVCLGLQAIGVAFGCGLKNLNTVFHGIDSDIIVTDKNELLFKGLGSSFTAGRYHSWVIDAATLNPELKITAISEDNEIMAITHNYLDVRGVQFHPESFLTPTGKLIIRNWIYNH